MSGLTEAERRGARLLAALLVLGTLADLHRAHRPEPAPAPARSGVGEAAAAPEPTGQRPDSVAARLPEAPAAPLDLNAASVVELDRLPGIGPVLARRIVEHRGRHGRFRAMEELLAVPGIGPRLLERLRPHLREPAR